MGELLQDYLNQYLVLMVIKYNNAKLYYTTISKLFTIRSYEKTNVIKQSMPVSENVRLTTFFQDITTIT